MQALEFAAGICYTEIMNNAMNFIAAYNEIDARMRAMYDGKGTPGFTDLVRRLAPSQSTIGKYEDELVAFSRLRNAIVHNTVSDRVIAEPNDEATALICHIAKLLTEPPKLNTLKMKSPVVGIGSGESVEEAAVKIFKTGYSNLPVYKGGRFIGIVNNRSIVRGLGEALSKGERADDFLKLPVEKLIRESDAFYYRVLRPNDTVQDALDAFSSNRRLLAVIVANGKGEILKILTTADIPRLISVLEAE